MASRIKSLWSKFIYDIDIFCEKESLDDDKSLFTDTIARYTTDTDERLEELSAHAGLRIGQLQNFVNKLKEHDHPSESEENLRQNL